MVGSLFSFVVVTGLLAAPAAGDFTFEGREATARTRSSAGFFAQGAVPFPGFYERGLGSADLTVMDRTAAPGASYGDTARLDARFRLGSLEYQVELLQPGFPPQQAGGVTAERPLPRPGHPVEGGVILDKDLNGNSGLGWPATTRVHAAVAVWGTGRVLLNGQLLTDSAVIHVAALSHGAQADDETHLTLLQAREGDTELHVLVWNLPSSAEPRGFIQFSFDDVEISLADLPVRSVASVPNVNPGGQDTIAAGGGGMVTGGIPLTPPAPPGDGVGGSGFDLEPAPVTGTPGGPVTPPALSSLGSFSVQPISPPNFGGFAGSPLVSPGIVATPPPLGSDPTTPTPPLLGSPAPLTASPAPPLLGTPAPLNVSPPPALIGTPPGTPVAPPGGTGVPPSI